MQIPATLRPASSRLPLKRVQYCDRINCARPRLKCSRSSTTWSQPQCDCSITGALQMCRRVRPLCKSFIGIICILSEYCEWQYRKGAQTVFVLRPETLSSWLHTFVHFSAMHSVGHRSVCMHFDSPGNPRFCQLWSPIARVAIRLYPSKFSSM